MPGLVGRGVSDHHRDHNAESWADTKWQRPLPLVSEGLPGAGESQMDVIRLKPNQAEAGQEA